MQLLQALNDAGQRQVLLIDGHGTHARVLDTVQSVYALAQQAIAADSTLAELAIKHAGCATVDIQALAAEGRLLAPLDHPDSAHLMVSGTGLTHLGSAQGRDQMHRDALKSEQLTDSMKMFQMGIQSGKPADGQTGVQPEWFYKGDGASIVPPGADLRMPEFALDGSEEPEIVGLYIIDPDGCPRRLGFALGNEFSDHITERQNYLFLAHSKLRTASFGPSLLLGELPQDVRGTSRILRNGKVLWEKPFLSGEANMSHSLGNLETHHFKYKAFCRPGQAHAHFFGTATLSFTDGIRTEPGDVFEIEASPFVLPLRNALRREEARNVTVRAL